ncbi:hypothetical protein [Novosphingobium sp.]|uniref:hypothetical protein n=1 Tax=Novosphingobium sp. TaxID=1874826 RepID=UPI0025CED078|nr:hypothetical protein [Novosphingobium sp.]MCC6925191.1 hypothetical protein [Novosphingobium sp.]
MEQFFRILLFSPRLTISVALLIIGGISGALKQRDDANESSGKWAKDHQSAAYSSAEQDVGGWGKDTRPAGRAAAPSSEGSNPKLWKNDDGVIFEEEDVKALDPSEYE